MARICIITPGQMSTNPRVVKEAQALTAAGHAVKLITGRFIDWAIDADRGFAREPWGRPTEVAFGPKAAPAIRLRQRLARVTAEIGVKAGFAGLASSAIHDAAGDLRRAAVAAPADLYLAHYDAALPAAQAAARRHGARFAFDAEDFHPGDLAATPENALPNRFIREVERRTLKDCAFVTAASPGIAQAYQAEYALAPPQVILNVFSRAEAPTAPTPRGRQARPSLYWFSQTIGPERGLEWALEAISKSTARPDLYLRGAVGPAYGRHLRDLAERLGIAAHLHLLPPVAPELLIREIADYDISYIGETGHTPNRRIALVNKLFASLTAGLPVVASDIPAHLRIAPECPGAMAIFPRGDAAALAGLLDDWLLTPERLVRAREAAWTLGQNRFNWELEQQKFLALVDAALARGRP